jgi:hypothetical protein
LDSAYERNNRYLRDQGWITGEIKTCESLALKEKSELKALVCDEGVEAPNLNRMLNEHHVLQVKFLGDDQGWLRQGMNGSASEDKNPLRASFEQFLVLYWRPRLGFGPAQASKSPSSGRICSYPVGQSPDAGSSMISQPCGRQLAFCVKDFLVLSNL